MRRILTTIFGGVPVRITAIICLSLVTLGGVWASVQAQGDRTPPRTIAPIPVPPPRPLPPPPDPGPHPIIQRDLTLTALRVEVQVKGATAATRIRQTLRNDNSWVAEGDFLLPLPEGASISDFALIDGDKRLTPETLDANQARQVYQDIVRKMRDPGLLEYQDRQTVRVHAYPFQPGQTRDVEISYNQTLGGTADLVKYQLPLRWAGWSRSSGTSFVLSYDIDSNFDLGTISSPTYGVSVRRSDDRHASGSYEATMTSFTNDFTLNIGRRVGDFGASLQCFPAQGGEDGYFLLSLLAAAPQSGKVVPKDVLCIIDKSGSMSGEKIQQAKGALRFVLNQLKPADRFNLVIFSDAVDSVFKDMQPANGAPLAQAQARVDKLDADGGTDINSALKAGAAMLKPDGRPTYVIFMTDGLPTVGETDVSNILTAAKGSFHKDVKLFVFGVGYDVNTTLLDTLSVDHKGSATYVAPGEDIEQKVSEFYARISSPALTGIKLELAGLDTYDVMPRELPDLFHNNELFITGRYRGTPSGTVKVSVSGLSGPERKTFTASIASGVGTNNNQVPRLWATRKVSFLLDQLHLKGENPELLGEVDRLATRFGIVTPYTSYLITEPNTYFRPEERRAQLEGAMAMAKDEESGQGAVGRSSVNQSNQSAAKAAAPQAPGQIAGGGYDKNAPPPPAEAPIVVAGRDGGEDDFDLRRGSADLNQTVNYVQNQTFVRQDDGPDAQGNPRYRWVDARKASDKPQAVRVQTYSDAYFALLSEFPELADFLSQGEAVTLVIGKDLVLETTPDDVTPSQADYDRLRQALTSGAYLAGK
jgi:Ca-activated chloride channel family protein